MSRRRRSRFLSACERADAMDSAYLRKLEERQQRGSTQRASRTVVGMPQLSNRLVVASIAPSDEQEQEISAEVYRIGRMIREKHGLPVD